MRRVINRGRYSVRKYYCRMFSAGVVAPLLVGAPVSAQENTNPEIEEKAMAVLKRMADVLAQTWYQPAYRGGNVTYIVVNPPQGATLIIR